MHKKDIKDLKKLREDLKQIRESQERFSKCYSVAHKSYCVIDDYIGELQEADTDYNDILKTVINLLEPKHKEHFKRYIDEN